MNHRPNVDSYQNFWFNPVGDDGSHASSTMFLPVFAYGLNMYDATRWTVIENNNVINVFSDQDMDDLRFSFFNFWTHKPVLGDYYVIRKDWDIDSNGNCRELSNSGSPKQEPFYSSNNFSTGSASMNETVYGNMWGWAVLGYREPDILETEIDWLGGRMDVVGRAMPPGMTLSMAMTISSLRLYTTGTSFAQVVAEIAIAIIHSIQNLFSGGGSGCFTMTLSKKASPFEAVPLITVLFFIRMVQKRRKKAAKRKLAFKIKNQGRGE